MKIYIPSRSRWGSEILTLRFLRGPAELVVPEDQAEHYGRAMRNAGHYHVTVTSCPPAVTNIAEKRLHIGQLAASRGENKFCMMDDDIYEFFIRKSPQVTNLVYSNDRVGEWTRMMGWLDGQLDNYAHASISMREGNHHAEPGERDTLSKYNTRTMRVLAYRTRDFLSVQHCRVPVMEDIDVNLQLLRRGLSNVCSFWWANGQRGTGAKGGCSDYRTHEVQDAAARRLVEMHPGLVKLRQKNNRAAGDFGVRTEVTVYWQKAFGSGS